jgi:hypothetical protein
VTDSTRLLLDRSLRYLIDPLRDVERTLTSESPTEVAYRTATDVAETGFAQINALMKLALDADDAATFARADEAWDEFFEDVWLAEPWAEEPDGGDDTLGAAAGSSAAVRRLIQYREMLRFGLAMWAAHRLATGAGAHQSSAAIASLVRLANRFDDLEAVFDAFDYATRQDDAEGESRSLRLPWSDWYLSELPEGRAHFIPTRGELLFTAVLIATKFCLDAPQAQIRPREWHQWRRDEIQSIISRLRSEASTWSSVWGGMQGGDSAGERSAPPPVAKPDERWNTRVDCVARMLEEAAQRYEASERAKLRQVPLDPERVEAFRSQVLAKNRAGRPLRELFRWHKAVEALPAPPEDFERQVYRLWLPKGFLTADSRIVGLDMVAGDLARATVRAEQEQLIRALDSAAQTEPVSDELQSALGARIGGMRKAGRPPSLVIVPIGWELLRTLGVERQWAAHLADHPLIPPTHRRRFDGVLFDVPVMHLPTAPADRLFLVDLAAGATYEEWPSEEESGLEFELRQFDREEAQAFLREHPEVKQEGRPDDQSIEDIQERALVTLRLCWRIVPGEADAVAAFEIPVEIRR